MHKLNIMSLVYDKIQNVAIAIIVIKKIPDSLLAGIRAEPL